MEKFDVIVYLHTLLISFHHATMAFKLSKSSLKASSLASAMPT